jgi:O-methyltransferase
MIGGVSAWPGRRASGESGARAECWLLAALGVSLAVTNYPLFVWRRFPMGLAEIFGAVLVAIAGVGALRHRRSLPDGSLRWCVAGLLTVPMLALIFDRLPGFSFWSFVKSYLHFGFVLAVFLAVASAPITARQLQSLLRVMTLAGVVVALYGIWQAAAVARGWPSGIEFLSRIGFQELRGGYGNLYRATSTLAEPRYLAIFLFPTMVYAFALAQADRALGRGLGWLAALIPMVLAVGLTGSFGGIPSMILLFVAMIVVATGSRGRSGRWRLVGVLAAVLIAGTLLVLTESPIGRWLKMRWNVEQSLSAEALPVTQGFSTRGVYLWNARYALAVFRERPVFGIGPGQLAQVGRVEGSRLGFSENVSQNRSWVGVAGFPAEFGAVGLLLLGVLLARVVWPGSRRAESGEADFPKPSMAVLLLLAVLLKETYSGFYIHLWSWFPLGIAALSSGLAAPASPGRVRPAPWSSKLGSLAMKAYYLVTVPLSVVFILWSSRIHPAYRMTFFRKCGLGLRMFWNRHRIQTGTSFKSHLAMALKILEAAPDVPGDVLECGTWKGGSAANLSLVCRIAGRRLRIYDSFQGLPAGTPGDRQASNYEPGSYRGALDEVRANIARYGAIECCQFIPGWFEDTLPRLDAPVLLAFLDVDLEASLDVCVRSIWPRLVEKGYIFIDEFLSLDYCSLFFSERYWREHFGATPPGLIGAGMGLALGEYYIGPHDERSEHPTQHATAAAYTRRDMSGHWTYYPAPGGGRKVT